MAIGARHTRVVEVIADEATGGQRLPHIGMAFSHREAFRHAVRWYWNPAARVLAESIYSTVHAAQPAGDGHLHIFQMRVQIEF